jgi:hypothetical protein
MSNTEIDFAEWLAEYTEIIREPKITLYRYCDNYNEWGNYTLSDIYSVFAEEKKPDQKKSKHMSNNTETENNVVICEYCGYVEPDHEERCIKSPQTKAQLLINQHLQFTDN